MLGGDGMAGLVFKQFTVNALSDDLNVRHMGIDDGEKNHPDQSDPDINSSQQKILQRCESIVHDAANTTTEFIERAKNRRNEIENEHPVTRTEGLPDNARLEIEKVIQGQRAQIKRRFDEYQRELRALRAYKAIHQLAAPANYPESHVLHWAFIFALMVMEAIANAYFFAQGSDLGLLGGVIQAFLISGVNVGVALFIGVVILPNLNLKIGILREARSKIIFSLALLAVLLYLPLVIAFNLLVAHFRDQLEITPFDAFNAAMAAVESFWNAPFGISNVDSWLLFGVGLLFAAIALLKGYTADDRNPGYGKLDRRFHQAESVYNAEEKKLIDAVNAKFTHFNSEVGTQIGHSNNLAKEYVKTVEGSRAAIEAYQRYRSGIEGIYRTLIKVYQASNMEVRTQLAPSYFEAQPVFTGPELSFKLDPDEEQRLGEFRRFSESVSEISKAVAAEMRMVGREAIKMVDDFLDVIKRTSVPADMQEDRASSEEIDADTSKSP
jgi:hypothetical protein